MKRTKTIPFGIRVSAPVVLGVAALISWQGIAKSGAVPVSLLPDPATVFARLAEDLVTGRVSSYVFYTLAEAVLGCLLASLIALPLGLLIARSQLVEAAISPYVAASQAIPAIAIAPLLVLWNGYGLRPIVLLCALLVFFPVTLSTVLGLRTIDKDLLEAAQLDGAAGSRLLYYIEAPLARRAVLTGLRNGFTLSITGAVVGEFVMGGRGLGMLLTVQSNSSDTVGLFSTLIVLVALATTIYLALVWVERFFDPFIDISLKERSS